MIDLSLSIHLISVHLHLCNIVCHILILSSSIYYRLTCRTSDRRTFNAAALQRHARVCQGVKSKASQRQTFNGHKARSPADGADLLAGQGQTQRRTRDSQKSASVKPISGTQSAWRDKSLELRQAMREARKFSKALAAGDPLPPAPAPSGPPAHYVQCPTCGRSFSEKAGERHIPKCKDIRAKPSFLAKGSGTAGCSPVRSRR